MKHIVLLSALVMSSVTLAAENCKPIHEAPVTVSVSGKSGTSSVTANEIPVYGNALAPTQPAEKLNFVAGSFAFSVLPASSCQDGLLLEFQNSQAKKQALVAWDREITVDGMAGSESYVNVTARKAKP